MARLTDLELAKAFLPDDAPSFADVTARIEKMQGLKPSRRRDLISGLNVVARAIGLAPAACLADPIWLRPRVAKIRPAALGISGKSWTNSISNARSALAAAGIVDSARGARMPLSPAWRELWEKVRAYDDDNIRLPLSRFPAFCSRIGVAPVDVTDETIADFRRALELNEIRKDPEKVAWQTAHAWNLAVERIPGWPQRKLQKPQRHSHYSLPIDAFPTSFQDDLAKLGEGLSRANLKQGAARYRPLSGRTIQHRMAQIRRFASALVAAGEPIEDLRSLADLLPLARIEVGVQWIADNRHGGGTSQGLRETMLGLSMLGRELGLDAAHLNAIRGYANALAVDKTGQRTRRKGLTEKNRERLRRLRDPETQLSLLHLPRNLLEKAAQERHPVKAARLAEVALAIAILTIAPIRLKNLASLEITRHFDRTSRARIYLVIPEVEVKNGKPLEFELSERVSAMLDAFLKRWHPRLTTRNCPWLFARCDGASHVHQTVLARRITETIRRELGLDVNAHLFRHFTAMFILERDPGAYDRVRLLLGHAALSETVTAYTGLESIDATRFLANAVEEELQKPPKPTRSRRGR